MTIRIEGSLANVTEKQGKKGKYRVVEVLHASAYGMRILRVFDFDGKIKLPEIGKVVSVSVSPLGEGAVFTLEG